MNIHINYSILRKHPINALHMLMPLYSPLHCYMLGTAVAQWLRCCATNQKVAGSIPVGVIDIKSSWSYYGPGVDSGSNINEYQEYFLGVKSGRCVRLITLPPSCAVVMKSGSFNLLEPSGPLQACNGTDLLFYCYMLHLSRGHPHGVLIHFVSRVNKIWPDINIRIKNSVLCGTTAT